MQMNLLFFLNPKGSKVLASKGNKTIYSKINNNEKECYTGLVTGNAAGQIAPPMVIFKYKRIPFDLSSSIPKDWGVGTSENGWMTADTFFCYITNVFYPWAKENIDFPIIFFVDGHSSHMSYHLSKFCSDNSIILVALYPNSTHLLQPMDVAVFRTLKMGWKEQVLTWRMENQGDALKKHNFVPLLDRAIKDRVTPNILKNGFRKTGLFPWNPDVVKDFFPHFDNATSNNVSTPSTRTDQINLDTHIINLEKYIETSTLAKFNEHINEKEWSGPNKDRSLFEVWRKMKNEQNATTHSTDLEQMINEADVIFDDSDFNIQIFDDVLSETVFVDTTNATVEITEIVNEPAENVFLHTNNALSGITVVNNPIKEKNGDDNIILKPEIDVALSLEKVTQHYSKVAEKEPTSPPKKNNNNYCSSDSNIPSPFKRALFWPESNDKNIITRKKEKIPYVVTSELWQQYNQKKLETKNTNEARKAENKRKREEKKKMITTKKVRKEHVKTPTLPTSSDSPECAETESEDQDYYDNKENNEHNNIEIKIQDYVIVLYEGEHFPGQVREVKKDEYLVSAMTPSGPSTWRWPQKEDRIWYKKPDVLEKVAPPLATNSRGAYQIIELEKYKN